MTSIKAAILATVQKVREYYQLVDSAGQKAIAIPPEWINSAPLVLHMQDKSQWPEKEKLQHEYELSRFVNAIQNNPFIWDSDGNVLWEVLRQVLDANNTEITENVLDSWVGARFLLEEQYVKTQSQGIDFLVTALDSNPQWNKITIEEDQFNDLIKRAEADKEFIEIYEIIQGGDLDEIADIQKISFEMTNIDIERPWLKEELLKSRQWRLRNNASIDGKAFLSSSEKDKAFEGALPGYPITFFLIRNLEVAFKVTTTENEEQVEQYLEEGKTLNFGHLLLDGNAKPVFKGKDKQIQMKGLVANLKTIDLIRQNFLKQFHIKINTGQYGPVKGTPGNVNAPANSPASNLLPKPGDGYTLPVKTNFPGSVKPMVTSNEPILLIIPALTEVKLTVTDSKQKPVGQAEVLFSGTEGDGTLSSKVVHTGSDGKISVKLAANSQYKVLITKPGYKEHHHTTITTKAGKATSFDVKLLTITGVDKTERDTNIQLLAVVYKKLGQSPNPIENFERFENSMF